jgi:hypothetical protein
MVVGGLIAPHALWLRYCRAVAKRQEHEMLPVCDSSIELSSKASEVRTLEGWVAKAQCRCPQSTSVGQDSGLDGIRLD